MNSDFSKILSQLRLERGLSQRKVSKDLNISQALLSHYENGVREPGLDFIVRVSDYYSVSTDYLLGRTLSKDGTMINMSEVHDAAEDKDNVLHGSVRAVLYKKLAVNSLSIIYDLMAKNNNSEMISNFALYTNAAIYRMYRMLYKKYGKNPELRIADADLDYELDVCMVQAKRDMANAVKTSKEDIVLSDEYLKREYPLLAASLNALLHDVEEKINKNF